MNELSDLQDAKKMAVETPRADGSTLWEIRTEEQPYAFLSDKEIKEENRYGQKIDLVDLTGLPEDQPMYINENPEVGCNPNRNKQHGFFLPRIIVLAVMPVKPLVVRKMKTRLT